MEERGIGHLCASIVALVFKHCATRVSTISDMSLHNCLPELISMARFNPCVILEIMLSHIFEKRSRRGGLGTFLQATLSPTPTPSTPQTSGWSPPAPKPRVELSLDTLDTLTL